METNKSFEVYKGLQKPLVFKSYKGRFIYWMAGGLFGSFILCCILCVLIGYIAGGIALFAGAAAVVTYVNIKQKNGIHSRTKFKGVVFIRPSFNRFRT
jgi:hypothetical protein